VCNELGDRAAELAVLAGCFALAPGWLVVTAMLAASAPSWVALAGVAAGATRINGGPVGKTERCLLLVVLAAVPAHAGTVLVVIAAGSALTAALRLRTLHRRLVP
jgi:CDP-diacylglycerol--glycerol-3-phosphate 3-phosphatidyltransferase